MSLFRAGQVHKARVVMQGVLMGFTFHPDVLPLRSVPAPSSLPLIMQPGSPQQA
jgi:hypothetical protein